MTVLAVAGPTPGVEHRVACARWRPGGPRAETRVRVSRVLPGPPSRCLPGNPQVTSGARPRSAERSVGPTSFYDPTTGTFLTRDPLVSTTREAYGYVGNSPLNRTDPSGLIWPFDEDDDTPVSGLCVRGVSCADGTKSLADTNPAARKVRSAAIVVGGGALLVAGCAALCPAAAAGAAGGVGISGTTSAGSISAAVGTGALIYGNEVDPAEVEELAGLPWERLMDAFRSPAGGGPGGFWLNDSGDTIVNGCHRVAAMLQQLSSGGGDPSQQVPYIGPEAPWMN